VSSLLTEIYLVRHAHSEYSAEQEATRGLSERGRIDALSVTELLSKERIEAVCSSPYVRAVQTVEGIARLVGTSIDIDARFREKDLGDYKSYMEDRWQAFQKGFAEPQFSFPHGESNRDVELRGVSAMNRILDEYAGKRVAIGIHGCIMTIIMAHYDARFDVDFLGNLPKPAIYKLMFNHVEYGGAKEIGTFGS
jgi:2,3-bisphosphoglycerate-dependent phosphoglycerate mutase